MTEPRAPHNAIEVFPLPEAVLVERDVGVALQDGTRLSANVFCPRGDGPWPVVLALTPYGKDVDVYKLAARSTKERAAGGLGMGQFRISDGTPFEAPDPAYWVEHGYAVAHVDLRGRGKSQGTAKPFSRRELADYGEIIEWAGTQAWSTGRVALHGVSYLAICQWHAAAAAPLHLAAIVPWEGAADPYRDVRFHGGVPETAFFRGWSRAMDSTGDAEAAKGPSRTPAIGEVGANAAKLEDIRVPALICGSWSDQGLHTRGCFHAFQTIGSKHKWLYTHGRGKWTVYYDADALDYQRRFLDHFLKGAANGFEREPRVRLEVRRSLDAYDVRSASDWPAPETQYRAAMLDAKTGNLTWTAPKEPSSVRYDSAADGGEVSFEIQFDRPTEITGHTKLALWVETDRGDDLDLFVGLEKIDVHGEVVHFEARENATNGMLSLGWLRASHRALDPVRSRPDKPFLSHDKVQLLEPGQRVRVEIEILPSSTRFDPGERLRLRISGSDLFSHGMLHHRESCNRGVHIIHTGGTYDSHLLLPIIER